MWAEFILVLSYSRRTQFVLVFGLLLATIILVGGEYLIGTLELRSLPAPAADAIREKLLHRYDKAAWVVLAGSLFTAWKCYRRDRRRILGM